MTAALLHACVFWSIFRQPLDASVPPRTSRAATWSLSFDSFNNPGPGADFFAVYHAGIQSRRRQSPYVASEWPRVTPYYFIYRYPPVVAQTLGRLANLAAPHSAYRAWLVVVEISLLALASALWRERMPANTRATAIVALLLSTPYFLELHMGQFTFISAAVTALIILALHRAPSGTPWRLLAAVPWVAVSVLKQFPTVVLAGLLATRRGRLPAMAALLAAAAVLAPGLIDESTRTEYARLNFVDDTAQLYPGNFALLYQVYASSVYLGSPFGPAAVACVSAVGGVVVLAAVAIALARARSTDVRRIGGTLMAGFFLAYFRVWEHHYSAVLVAGILVLTSLDARDNANATEQRSLVLAGIGLVALPTAFRWLPPDPATWSPAQYSLLAYPKLAGAVAIVLAGVRPLREAAARSVTSPGAPESSR